MAKRKHKVLTSNKQKPAPDNSLSIPWYNRNSVSWLVICVVIFFVTIVRLRLLSLPLERDEGEYAYMGQLLLNGFAPFTHAYNMKFPGTSMMYAFFMPMLGESPQGIHLILLLINISTIVLLFMMARRYLGNKVAVIGATSFALFSISPALIGSAAHATHFVVFFALTGIYFLLKTLRNGKNIQFFISGLLLGFSILMKQPGFFFAVFGGLVFIYDQLLVNKVSWKQLTLKGSMLGIGIILPVGFLFLWMYLAGVFDRFWFWTFVYGGQYASGSGLGINNLKLFIDSLKDNFPWLWILACAGLVCLWLQRWERKKKLFILTLIIFSLLSVSPGFYFRGHYFVLLAPVAGLLCGITIDWIHNFILGKSKVHGLSVAAELVYAFICLVGIYQLRNYFFNGSMREVSRMLYGNNPFPESIPIARYIKTHTRPADKIAVVASEPEIYFYADRISATGYIYTYSLMEDQPFNLQMQDEMIAEIEAAKPEMIVFCKVPQSWTVRDNSPEKIFDWATKYASENYDLVGVAEIPNDMRAASYYWDEEVKGFQAVTDNDLYVFRRKER